MNIKLFHETELIPKEEKEIKDILSICEKREKALEIISQLYKDNTISVAYIVGSIASGIPKEMNDIDILIINSLFKDKPKLTLDELKPIEFFPNECKVAESLKKMYLYSYPTLIRFHSS